MVLPTYTIDFNFFFHIHVQLRPLLDGNRLGQVARKVDVQALHHCKPVGDELQRDDVENTLQDIDGLRDLNRLGLRGLELRVAGVADDDRLATTGNDYT